MVLNVYKELNRAKDNGILDLLYQNDPRLTYQQFILYNMLRVEYSTADEKTCFDPDLRYEQEKKNGVLDETWLTMKGSKFHRMAIETPWDKVFDK